MKGLAPNRPGHRLNLLFFSAGGVDFCVDTEQIESISDFNGEESEDLIRLHEELRCPAAALSSTPLILKIKTGECALPGILVDRMTDIVETDCRNIHPLPSLIEIFALKKGVWGVLPHEGRIVLIIDFLILAGRKGHKQ